MVRQRNDSAASPRGLRTDQDHMRLTVAEEMQGTGEETRWVNGEVTFLLRCCEVTPAISST